MGDKVDQRAHRAAVSVYYKEDGWPQNEEERDQNDVTGMRSYGDRSRSADDRETK
jgi:hypothetical protein